MSHGFPRKLGVQTDRGITLARMVSSSLGGSCAQAFWLCGHCCPRLPGRGLAEAVSPGLAFEKTKQEEGPRGGCPWYFGGQGAHSSVRR